MAQNLVNGALLSCSFGLAPSSMNILPINRIMIANQPAGNIQDNVPMMNIMPFGMCITLSNPQVAAATSAALGVLTPQPCIPVTSAPWVPGSATVMIGRKPALQNSCQLMCQWGGVIAVNAAAQVTVNSA
ncbi:MAG: DUF4280 domain-containing protein [Planctomycetota bacterium]|jgi:hypothetical protein